MKEVRVQVVVVTRMVDLVTGKPVVQVNFGTPNEINKEILERLEGAGQVKAQEVYSNIASVVVPLEEGFRYRVGTNWIINTNEKGTFTIKEADSSA